MHFSTSAIHNGQEPEKITGAIVPPIFMTSTYVQEAPGILKGYDYTRAGNPNFTNLERTMAALEGGSHATIFSSGLGAIAAFASTLEQGSTVIAGNDLYGGTYRLFEKIFSKFGVVFQQIRMTDLYAVETALRRKPQIVLIETPSNPLLQIIDVAAITAIAKRHGVLSVVDNTFASPYFQQPLQFGADASLHSSTKYIGGHSDVIGGVIVSNDTELKEKMDFARMALGLNPSPFDAWLLSRSLKTLAPRMEQHQSNAMSVAQFLETHPKTKRVYYPGLSSHEGYEIAKRQMSGFSGIVSAEFNLSLEAMKLFISSLNIFSLAESLGGVESLVDHPASMTHASIPREEREKTGLTDGLVRFSVGIEDVSDLLDDLDSGLRRV